MTKQAEAIRLELETLAVRYASMGGDVPLNLRKIANRAKEYSDKSFVILVAGPVKSGKSTFVNLVANAFVSPTHFLECTVRPSIISSTDSPEDELITAYRSQNPSRSVEQVDAIIDCLRGLIKHGDIPEVMTETWPLTEASIDEHVALDLSDAGADGTLMTTIRTPGGRLLTGGVYLIDMPGFDGSVANLDSPLYKTIAARADLIILVQSSNSAITKVSDDFFRLLKENNRNVPVCLLHNVFDAAYWRADELKAEVVREHMDYAVARIKEKGFNLDAKNAYVVNLGMVWDWRMKSYSSDAESLEAAAVDFGKIEEEMYDVLISQRDSIRVRNVVGRTLQQTEDLIGEVDVMIAEMDAAETAYNSVKASFDTLKSKDIPIEADVNVDYFSMRNEITGIYTMSKRSLSGRYSAKETREIVSRFISDCSKAIGKKVNEALRYLDVQVNGEAVTVWKSEIADVLRRCNVDEPLPPIGMNGFPPVVPELDMLDPGKIVPWALFKYNVNKVNEFLAHVYYFLVGREDSADVGYISFMLPEFVENEACEHRDKVKERIDAVYGRFVEKKRREALCAIMPDQTAFRKTYDLYVELRSDLERVRKTTENALKL